MASSTSTGERQLPIIETVEQIKRHAKKHSKRNNYNTVPEQFSAETNQRHQYELPNPWVCIPSNGKTALPLYYNPEEKVFSITPPIKQDDFCNVLHFLKQDFGQSIPGKFEFSNILSDELKEAIGEECSINRTLRDLNRTKIDLDQHLNNDKFKQFHNEVIESAIKKNKAICDKSYQYFSADLNDPPEQQEDSKIEQKQDILAIYETNDSNDGENEEKQELHSIRTNDDIKNNQILHRRGATTFTQVKIKQNFVPKSVDEVKLKYQITLKNIDRGNHQITFSNQKKISIKESLSDPMNQSTSFLCQLFSKIFSLSLNDTTCFQYECRQHTKASMNFKCLISLNGILCFESEWFTTKKDAKESVCQKMLEEWYTDINLLRKYEWRQLDFVSVQQLQMDGNYEPHEQVVLKKLNELYIDLQNVEIHSESLKEFLYQESKQDEDSNNEIQTPQSKLQNTQGEQKHITNYSYNKGLLEVITENEYDLDFKIKNFNTKNQTLFLPQLAAATSLSANEEITQNQIAILKEQNKSQRQDKVTLKLKLRAKGSDKHKLPHNSKLKQILSKQINKLAPAQKQLECKNKKQVQEKQQQLSEEGIGKENRYQIQTEMRKRRNGMITTNNIHRLLMKKVKSDNRQSSEQI